MDQFEGLIELGLVRAWGVSNFDADQLRSVLEISRPAVVQNSYSVLDRDDEAAVIPLCTEFDIAFIPFSPLAGGWLTGKYKRGEPPPAGSRMALRPGPYEELRTDATFAALDRFAEAAAERGFDMATLALAWLLSRPFVTSVIVGPRSPQQLEPAIAALDVRLSPDEADELAALFD